MSRSADEFRDKREQQKRDMAQAMGYGQATQPVLLQPLPRSAPMPLPTGARPLMP
eukprot:CAMPEP_0119281388 /NCGR_PEP_ID=MMETSP1329-20130426/24651_1 /TAXON_ID=114041 /ORGANISM="Genus nov. species nov., Strain RCC1024" /LENGTH=54 /DNA_ID=CAMNT_0007282005 /DNA_START=188 /DNA_END=349 /DNA_ORIENTATION=-